MSIIISGIIIVLEILLDIKISNYIDRSYMKFYLCICLFKLFVYIYLCVCANVLAIIFLVGYYMMYRYYYLPKVSQ